MEYKSSLRDSLEARRTSLNSERSSWDAHWKELAEYILPRRGRFMVSDYNKGGAKNDSILDNTATLAARTLASGMMSGLTSPSRPWFKLTTPDPEMMDHQPVKVWLDDVERILRLIFSRSNFYTGIHALFAEHGIFGTAPMFMLEDYEDVIRVHPATIGSYTLGVNHRQMVDTIYRELPLSVGAMVEWFGLENVSETTKSLYDKGKYDEVGTVYHAVEPNRDSEDGKADFRGKPYRSVYWEDAGTNKSFLRISGFKTLPFFAPRWEVTGTDVYGGSAGMVILEDTKQLQAQQKYKGKAIAKMVDPPMVGAASLKNKVTTTIAGGVTYVDPVQGKPGFSPAYLVSPDVQGLNLDIQETQHRISRGLYEDLFLMLANDRRNQRATAREVAEHHEEKLLALGPVLERSNDELLDPVIDRAFNLAQEAGILPEPPPALDQVDLRVEYISIMAQAQKMIGVGAIERVVGFVGNLAAVKPDVLDKVDTDAAIDEYSDSMGTPARVIRSTEDANAGREQRAQAEQQAQQAAAMQQGAETVNTAAAGAKTLSEAGDGQGAEVIKKLLGG
ncbi:MAG: phage tail protein [Gammaproteobacteria bacterium]|nr:phage tail protein [Gammaproteobacteria bacterium]